MTSDEKIVEVKKALSKFTDKSLVLQEQFPDPRDPEYIEKDHLLLLDLLKAIRSIPL